MSASVYGGSEREEQRLTARLFKVERPHQAEVESERLRAEQLRTRPAASLFSASSASMSRRSSAPSSSSHRLSSSASSSSLSHAAAAAAADELPSPAAPAPVNAEASKTQSQLSPPPPAAPPPSPPPVFSPSTPVSPLPVFSLSPVPSPPLVALPSPLPSASSLPHSSQLHFSFLHSSPLRNIEQPGRSFHLDIPLETADFQRVLSASGLQYRAQWEVATIDHLLSALSSSVCLHISGHGDPRALVMEDGLGGVVQLQVEVLERVLRMGGVRRLRFVFVSSCYSYRAALAFSVAGVAHVMAVQEGTKVTDSSARVFACAVYAALCRGQTVREAYESGQRAVASLTGSNPPCCCAHLHVAPSCSLCRVCRTPVCCPVHSLPCHSAFMHQPAPHSASPAAAAASSAPPSCCQPQLPHDEFLKFLLLPSSCSQDEPVFSPATVPVGPFINRTPPSPPHNLPPAPAYFGGRARDQLALVSLLLPHRVVAVTAVEGMGKSAVAVAAARYLMERRHFSAVWRVDCAGLRDVRQVDRELARVLGVGGGEGQEEQAGQELSREEELRLHERVVGCLRHGRERATVLLLLDNVDALLTEAEEEDSKPQREQEDAKAEQSEIVWVDDMRQQQQQEEEQEGEPFARQGQDERPEVASVSLLLQQYQRLAQRSPEEVKGSGRGAAGRERSRERLRSAESSSSNRALSSPPTLLPAAAAAPSSGSNSGRKVTQTRRGEEGRFATLPGKKPQSAYHPILSSSPQPLQSLTPGWEEDWDDWEEVEPVELPSTADGGRGSRGRARAGQRRGPSLPLSRFTRNNRQEQQRSTGSSRPHGAASELSSPELPSRSSSAAAASSSLQSLLSLSMFSSSAASSSVSGSGPLSGSLVGLSPLIPIISESSALWRFVKRTIGSSRRRGSSGRRRDSTRDEEDGSSLSSRRRQVPDGRQTRRADEGRLDDWRDRGREDQDERDEKGEQQQQERQQQQRPVDGREGEAEGEVRWPEVELAVIGVDGRDAGVAAAATAAAPLTDYDEEIALTAVRMGFPRSRCVQAIQTLRAQRLAARKAEQQQQQQPQQSRQPAAQAAASPSSSPSAASPMPAPLTASVVSASPAPMAAGDAEPEETWEDDSEARREGEQEAALLLSRDEVTLSLQSLLTWLLDHEGDGADEPYVTPPHIYLRPLIDDELPAEAALQQHSSDSSSAVVVVPPASAAEPLPSSPSSLRSWLLRHQLEDQLGALQQHGVKSLSQLLALDDAELKAAGITRLGRRKSLLRAIQQEAETQQRRQRQQQDQLSITVSAAAPARGKQAVAQYLLSLLEQTSCHFLITSRSPLPRIPAHPSRRYELPPLHPLDTVQLYLRASSPLNPAQLRPFVSAVRHLPDLLAHPLFSCMAGNARATVLCALLGSAVSVYSLWQLLREEDDSRADALAQETGLSAEAVQRLTECRRLVREMRKGDETQPSSPMPSSSFSVSPVASPQEPPQPPSPLFASNAFSALAAPPLRPAMARLASEPLHSNLLPAALPWTPPSSDLPSAQPSSVSSLFNSLRPAALPSVVAPSPAASASQSLSPPSSSLYPPAPSV